MALGGGLAGGMGEEEGGGIPVEGTGVAEAHAAEDGDGDGEAAFA